MRRRLRASIASLGALLVLIALHGTVPFGATAHQAFPQECGYLWTDNMSPDPVVVFDWVEISESGTRVAGWTDGDGFAGPYPIGFGFPFYDRLFSEFFVGPDGYLSFGSGHGDPPFSIPSGQPPNNIAAAFGVGLVPWRARAPNGVYYEALSGPNRLVVEYRSIGHYPFNDYPVTFETILHESGEIWFQYLTVQGDVYVVGVENETGERGTSYAGEPSNGLAIRFSGGATAPAVVAVEIAPCFQTRGVLAGTRADLDLTIINQGTTAADSFDLTFRSISNWSAEFYEMDGATLLTDTNGNGVPDTGPLPPSGGSRSIRLRISVPPDALAPERMSVVATSSVDPTVMTFSYADLVPGPAIFSPPHAEDVEDSDGDGLWNGLVVMANVSVAVPGTYTISGFVSTPIWWLTLHARNESFLDIGNHTVRLEFDGRVIHRSGLDGPYAISLGLFDPGAFQRDTFTTRNYSHLEFDPPPILLAPPHSDSGVDTDLDGRYNLLAVDANVTVDVAGDYVAEGVAYTEGWSESAWNASYLDPGRHTLRVLFDAFYVNMSRVDGPYRVEFRLRSGPGIYGSLWDIGGHETGPYLHTDFEEPYAAFAPPHTDAARDLDGDGSFDVLLVDVHVSVSVPGSYWFHGTLQKETLEIYAFNETHLDPGLRMVRLSFRGDWIHGSSVDGPYEVHLSLYNWRAWWGSDVYSTQGYVYTDFDRPKTLVSRATSRVPVVDGILSEGEWEDATLVNLSQIEGNRLGANLYVKHSHRFVYIAFDAVGDIHAGGDFVELSFDTGNDGRYTDGREDQFVQASMPDAQAHSVYDSATGWWSVEDGPYDSRMINHSGLASSSGFGSSSSSAVPHRMYEFSIPLALIGAAPGDVLGFAGWVWDPRAFGFSPVSGWPELWAWPLFAHGDLLLNEDNLPPSLTVVSPLPGAIFQEGAVTAKWDARDDGFGLDRFDLMLDGSVLGSAPADQREYSLVSLADGHHTLQVGAFDHGGNGVWASVAFAVDTSPPTVTAVVPQYGSIVTSSTVRVAWMAADATSGVKRITLSLDGGPAVDLPISATDHVFSDVPDGTHLLQLTVWDRVGLSLSIESVFSVDTQILSPTGPYGIVPLASLVVALSAPVAILFWLRRRGRRLRPPS